MWIDSMLHPLRTYATTPLGYPLSLQGGPNRDEAAGKTIHENDVMGNCREYMIEEYRVKAVQDESSGPGLRVCYQSETVLAYDFSLDLTVFHGVTRSLGPGR
jgi:hypothetical protein